MLCCHRVTRLEDIHPEEYGVLFITLAALVMMV
jgi:hypothetical protein